MPTYQIAIANVYNSVTDRIEKNVANVAYGDLTSGTGTIRVFTGNNTVIGNGTAFTTQLGNNYVIRNSANVFVGRIASIANANSATLTTHANVAIADSAFKFHSYMANIIVYDPNLGTGNISVFTTNNAVIGTNTTFLTQLDVGYQIFEPVTDSNSIYRNLPNLLGVIKSISSNIRAEFTTVASKQLIDNQFRFYNTETKNTSNIFPRNGHLLHSAMLEWSKSGLIPGLKQVHHYHPPIPDPVTGILVNFPATIHSSNTISNIYSISGSAINNLYSINGPSVGDNHVTTGFNDSHSIVGSSHDKAVKSIPINRVLKKLAQSDLADHQYNANISSIINVLYSTPQLLPPPGVLVDSPPAGFELVKNLSVIDQPYTGYQGPGGNVVYVKNETMLSKTYNTIADRLAIAGNHPPPQRVTDDKASAVAYFSSNNDNDLTDAQRSDLAARAGSQFSSGAEKKLLITGVPCAIPGQLNAVLYDEDPNNRKYVIPNYNKPFNPGIDNYNSDLPVSPLNNPKNEYKINR